MLSLWHTSLPISRWTNDTRAGITCGSTTLRLVKQSFGQINPSLKPIKLSPQSSYKCGFHAPPARVRRPCASIIFVCRVRSSILEYLWKVFFRSIDFFFFNINWYSKRWEWGEIASMNSRNTSISPSPWKPTTSQPSPHSWSHRITWGVQRSFTACQRSCFAYLCLVQA